ncbi:paraquat-inducible protein B (plasmid) [Pacificitalea manganoxidans]|uniref:Paraquat-inducible protein B n=1 Tax=Pacificitalea manganoxidans TaxID=1411902 RepID=A0A291M420_9RHOB|nr:MlaD family protein [Pacificitalea manganoxidans]ATI43597.1 paraquat-inducible protein B [Pacificitalea manganoxidans]MDR6309964.1 paraquat-inducible protein B [Pacificitalea manganoxidans]
MTDTPPDLPIAEGHRSIWSRISIVWLIPVIALAIALGVAWQNYSNKGPLIEIVFDSASGVKEGETELRYREVTVGIVEEVGFSSELDKVKVSVRIGPEIADFVDREARFWVVQPEVSARGVTGLTTVLSGVYIEGAWDDKPGGLAVEHEGLSTAPLLRAGQDGLTIQLRAQPGSSLSRGTPILFKGIEVGQIGEPQILTGGVATAAEAVVYAPYSSLISTNTRFWDTTGFSFSIGPGGAELNFSSLASLISGGVAFDTVVSGGEAVPEGSQFDLYPDEGSARTSIFNRDEGQTVNFAVIFDDNVSGLASGAAVELRGVQIGEVENVNGIVDRERFGDDRVRLLATLSLRPARLGLESDERAEDFLSDRVAAGLRARLASASILTGGLKVELILTPEAEPAALDMEFDPYPLLPTTENDISDVSATAEGVFQRINELPIEELIGSAIGFLNSATALVSDEKLRQVPADVSNLLGDVRGIVGSEEVQALPAQLASVMTEIEGVSADLRAVVQDLNEAEAVDRLLAAVDNAAQAAQSVTDSTEGVPALIDRVNAIATNVEELPLERLVTELSDLAETADRVLGSEETEDLLVALEGALTEGEAMLAEIRQGGSVENLNAALASAGDAARAVEVAAGDLPALVRRMDVLLGDAQTTLRGFDSDSELNRTARAAAREVEKAAQAIESLARTLARRPNSIILGR